MSAQVDAAKHSTENAGKESCQEKLSKSVVWTLALLGAFCIACFLAGELSLFGFAPSAGGTFSVGRRVQIPYNGQARDATILSMSDTELELELDDGTKVGWPRGEAGIQLVSDMNQDEFERALKDRDQEIASIRARLEAMDTSSGSPDMALYTDLKSRVESMEKDRSLEVSNNAEMEELKREVETELSASRSTVTQLSSNVDSMVNNLGSKIDSSIDSFLTPRLNAFRTEMETMVQSSNSGGSACTRESGSSSGDADWNQIDAQIHRAIEQYAYADATGEIDYILEVQEESSTWNAYNQFSETLNYLLGNYRVSTVVLEPIKRAGDCWPMAKLANDNYGYMIVKLRAPITLTHVRLTHIDQRVTANPEATPKGFRVSVSADDSKYEHVGEFAYDNTGKPSQKFVTTKRPENTLYVRFDFDSNYGHPDYSCVYRLRAHGLPSEH